MQTDATPSAGDAAKPKSSTRWLPAIARVLMGLMFFASGLMGLLLHPQSNAPMPEGAKAFFEALKNTGYMMPLVMGTQLLVGVLLLLNRFVPLALALIAPIIVGIITFHIFLAPAGIGPGIVVLIIELFLAWSYRHAFCPMLAMRVTPGGK